MPSARITAEIVRRTKTTQRTTERNAVTASPEGKEMVTCTVSNRQETKSAEEHVLFECAGDLDDLPIDSGEPEVATRGELLAVTGKQEQDKLHPLTIRWPSQSI